MEVRQLYGPPAELDIGNIPDSYPPVFEPVYEYLIPDALINSYGYIFKNFKVVNETILHAHRNTIGWPTVIRNCLLKRRIKIKEPAISFLSGWPSNIYHFTIESLPKLFLLQHHLDTSTVAFHQNDDRQPFHEAWVDILGLKNVTFIGNREVLSTPLAISSSFASRELNFHEIIMPAFRQWLLEKIGTIRHSSARKIFVGRRGRFRELINLKDVRKLVEEFGYTYLEMEDFGLREQIDIFRNANKIIATHGAALTHLCFVNPRTKVLDLMHQGFPQLSYFKMCKVLDLDYSIMKCAGPPIEGFEAGYADISVDLVELEKQIMRWEEEPRSVL